MFLSKKLILFSLCIFLFLPMVAHAEVTCCACENEQNTSTLTPEGIMIPSTEWRFIGFACAQGSHACDNYVCPSGEQTNTARNGTWRPYTSSENYWARGDTVTCCACGDRIRTCRAVNQTCDTICGDHGFPSGGNFFRVATEESATGRSNERGAGLSSPTEQSTSIGFTPPDPQAPKISLPIPGFVGFSQVKVEDGSINVPWIAEYVNAIYNFMLAIAGGVASFIFIVAGFMYITARGDAGKVGKAKKMMSNALVGIFMTFGAFLILYTINPELTSFKSIRLDVIKRNELKFDEVPVADQEGNVAIGDMAATGNFTGSSATNWTDLRNLAGCTRTPYTNREEALQAFRRATQAFISSRNAVDYVSGGNPSATTCGSFSPQRLPNYSTVLTQIQNKTNICLDCATFTRALFQCLGFTNITVALPPLYSEANRPYYRRFLTSAHTDPEKNTQLLSMYGNFISSEGRSARGTTAMVRNQQADFASATEFVRRVQSGEVILQPGDMIVNGAFERTSTDRTLHPTTGHFVTSLDGNLSGNTIEVTSGTNGSLWRATGSDTGTFDANTNGGAVITRPLMNRYTSKMNIENNLNGIFPVILIRVIH